MQRVFGMIAACLILASSSPADTIVLVAGGDQAKLESPFGVAFDSAGNLYYVEMTANRVGRIDPKGQLTTVVGTGQKGAGGDKGPALKAELNGPHSLIASGRGISIADTWNNRVRWFDPVNGTIIGIGGTGEKGFAGDDGYKSKAKFGGVYCVAIDPADKTMYLADLDNRRIRAIDLKTGIVKTVAGNGMKGIPADGAKATEAPLLDPRAVAVDDKDNVYILERAGHCLRVVDSQGIIRTIAGTGKAGFGGDGGNALKAQMNGPKHLCIDRDGGVLIADTENHVIRKYTPADGKIVRVAGTGKKGSAGVGGPPKQCELNQPHGISLHASGDLYISDSSNNRILKIVRDK